MEMPRTDGSCGRGVTLHCICFFACLLLLAAVAPAQAAPVAKEEAARLSPAERWVLERLTAGQVAELDDPERPGWPRGTSLHSAFLEKLLSGHFKNIHWRGVRIEGAVFPEPLNLEWADVPYNVALENCTFEEQVDFSHTRFVKDLKISNSTFQHPADFKRMSVGGSLVANDVKFEDQAGPDFESLEAAGDAFFRNSKFKGPAIFRNANIKSGFVADGAVFGYRTKKPTEPQTWGAIFNLMKVETVASFKGTIFVGPADFRACEVGAQLFLREAHFDDQEERASFQFMKALNLSAQDTVFAGSVDFREARIPVLDLVRVRIDGDEARFGGMRLETLYNLELNLRSEPHRKTKLFLSGTTYQTVEHPDRLFQLIDRAEWDSQSYSMLEEYLKDHGKRDFADEVFVRMKRRGRSYLGPGGRLWDWFLDRLVLYGRAPWRAFTVAAVFVVFGMGVFRRRDVMPQKPGDGDNHYSPFWYSLDLLVPAIDLQAASEWRPNPASWFRRNYARVHRLLGWVLIPIGLAAVGGLIK